MNSPISPLETVANNLMSSQDNQHSIYNNDKNSSSLVSNVLTSPDDGTTTSTSTTSWSSYAVRGLVGTVTASILAFTIPFFIVPWLPRKLFGALPYYATSARRIHQILKILPSNYIQPGRKFIDLGSGDGVAVFAAADNGLDSVGM